MNKVMIRLKNIRKSETMELVFDRRLSFKENINLLNMLREDKIDNFLIYDPIKRIFLDIDIPLERFNINGFMMFDLFA